VRDDSDAAVEPVGPLAEPVPVPVPVSDLRFGASVASPNAPDPVPSVASPPDTAARDQGRRGLFSPTLVG
jgi:hypothetical protein